MWLLAYMAQAEPDRIVESYQADMGKITGSLDHADAAAAAAAQ